MEKNIIQKVTCISRGQELITIVQETFGHCNKKTGDKAIFRFINRFTKIRNPSLKQNIDLAQIPSDTGPKSVPAFNRIVLI